MIHIGHVLDSLRAMPAQSVHCVVTSPPYWGLRVYGTDPQVWGGDRECSHEWESCGVRHKGGPQGKGGERANRDTSAQTAAQHVLTGQTCQTCGAWRGELGSEPTPQLFVAHLVELFREVWRVLRDDGTLWLNLGDSYANDGKWGGKSGGLHVDPLHGNSGVGRRRRHSGLKPKDLCGIPWRVAFALQDDGWYLRTDNIWWKPNAMPFSVTDRPSTNHEYVFLLTKQPKYFWDHIAVQEPANGTAHSRGNGVNPKAAAENSGSRQNSSFSAAVRDVVETRNLRTVWRIPSQPYRGAHFATFPGRLAEICIKAGTSEVGCCPTCGAPWRRIYERQRIATRPGHDTKIRIPKGWAVGPGSHGTAATHMTEEGLQRRSEEVGNRDPKRHITRYVTTGWRMTCGCPYATPRPCIVLDTFLGSGTTAAVAEYLGRDWEGCELNAEYAVLADQRIAEGYRPPKVRPARRRQKRSIERLLFQ